MLQTAEARGALPLTGERYGNYELVRLLATGGMAEVFLARQRGFEGFEKHVVVKRIRPNLAKEPELVRMFINEARVVARLNHPNIVQIYNLGAQGKTYFIAMEYVEGRDLRSVMRQCFELSLQIPVGVACRIAIEAASALDHAHKRTWANGKPMGIVHRDVTPDNILIADAGTVKLVDFGVAKVKDSGGEETEAGVLKGKYAYMSPEQASGRPIDHRTDVFALGVVLHEMLVGQRLFKRESDMATLRAVQEAEVPAPSSLVKSLPKALDAIVLRALERKASKRFSDALELQVALDRFLVSQQVPSSSSLVAQFLRELAAKKAQGEASASKVSTSKKRSKSQGSSKPPDSKPSKPAPASQRKEDSATRFDRPPAPSGRARSDERALGSGRNVVIKVLLVAWAAALLAMGGWLLLSFREDDSGPTDVEAIRP